MVNEVERIPDNKYLVLENTEIEIFCSIFLQVKKEKTKTRFLIDVKKSLS